MSFRRDLTNPRQIHVRAYAPEDERTTLRDFKTEDVKHFISDKDLKRMAEETQGHELKKDYSIRKKTPLEISLGIGGVLNRDGSINRSFGSVRTEPIYFGDNRYRIE